MRLLMKIRKLSDIFELLENERKRSLTIFERICQDGLEPAIIWKIKTFEQNGFYKVSDEFSFDDLKAVLYTHYDISNDVYKIAIQGKGVNNLPNNNIDVSNIVFSFLSVCEIKELNFRSKTNFHCVFPNTPAKVLLFKIDNFSKLIETNQHKEFTLSIYLNLNSNFSSIFSHICKNYYEYYSLPTISKLPTVVLNLILKCKNLNVRNQDEVLFSILTYCKKISFEIVNNKPHSKPESVEELFNNVKWEDVSLDGLLEFILNESKLLLNSGSLQETLIAQFRKRFKEDNLVMTKTQENEGKSFLLKF